MHSDRRALTVDHAVAAVRGESRSPGDV